MFCFYAVVFLFVVKVLDDTTGLYKHVTLYMGYYVITYDWMSLDGCRSNDYCQQLIVYTSRYQGKIPLTVLEGEDSGGRQVLLLC